MTRYACLELDSCECPNPYHTKFYTDDLKLAKQWLNEDILKRKVQRCDEGIVTLKQGSQIVEYVGLI